MVESSKKIWVAGAFCQSIKCQGSADRSRMAVVESGRFGKVKLGPDGQWKDSGGLPCLVKMKIKFILWRSWTHAMS